MVAMSKPGWRGACCILQSDVLEQQVDCWPPDATRPPGAPRIEQRPTMIYTRASFSCPVDESGRLTSQSRRHDIVIMMDINPSNPNYRGSFRWARDHGRHGGGHRIHEARVCWVAKSQDQPPRTDALVDIRTFLVCILFSCYCVTLLSQTLACLGCDIYCVLRSRGLRSTVAESRGIDHGMA